jgi:hypothetical protein
VVTVYHVNESLKAETPVNTTHFIWFILHPKQEIKCEMN